MIAGILMISLLNANGETQRAIACAAFCIVTSITMVRLVLESWQSALESSDETTIAARTRQTTATRIISRCEEIVFAFFIKNIVAIKTKDGKAIFSRILDSFLIRF